MTCMVLDDLHEQLPSVECDVDVKPAEERACNEQLCVQPRQLDIVSISSNRVVGTAHWRAGAWGGVSYSGVLRGLRGREQLVLELLGVEGDK